MNCSFYMISEHSIFELLVFNSVQNAAIVRALCYSSQPVDDINYNSSSETAGDSFNGTRILLMQVVVINQMSLIINHHVVVIDQTSLPLIAGSSACHQCK